MWPLGAASGALELKLVNLKSCSIVFNSHSSDSELVSVAADLGDWELMCLCPVDADGNVSVGGAQFLVEPAVGADPQVILCDFHLEDKHNCQPQKHFTVLTD